MSWQLARLASRHWETPTAATLRFELPGGPLVGQKAGQHVEVRLTAEDGYQAQRSYSIASPPEDAGLELTVEHLDGGEVSGYLVEDMLAGDELDVRGPIGGWFNWSVADGGPLLLLAGGSGIVPLMAMLRHRHRQASVIPAHLLVSVRSLPGLFYARELQALAAAGDGFGLTITLTREAPPGWDGPTGRIDRALLADVVWPAASGARAFVCGPTSMVEAAASALVDLGYPPERVKAERFGPSGIAEAGPGSAGPVTGSPGGRAGYPRGGGR